MLAVFPLLCMSRSPAQDTSATGAVLPYSLPVVLPVMRTSPLEDPAAPYTPTVGSLIKKLKLHTPQTSAELAIAAALLPTHGGTYAHPDGSNPTCHNPANVNVKTATTPRIMPMCFSDGLGINVDAGPYLGRTTGLPYARAGIDVRPGACECHGTGRGREGET